MRLREHRHNLKEGLLEKSKLAQHAYKEGHKVGWDKVGFWILKATAGIGNTKKRPIWLALSTQFGHFSHLDPHYQQ
jgi:hypothetical protein